MTKLNPREKRRRNYLAKKLKEERQFREKVVESKKYIKPKKVTPRDWEIENGEEY
jgi:hypothetical protein